jgi:hypothetical protein
MLLVWLHGTLSASSAPQCRVGLLLGGLVLDPPVVVHTETFWVGVVRFVGPHFRQWSLTLVTVVTKRLVLDAGRQLEVLVAGDLVHQHSGAKASCKSKAEEKGVGGRVAKPGLPKRSLVLERTRYTRCRCRQARFAFSVSGAPACDSGLARIDDPFLTFEYLYMS